MNFITERCGYCGACVSVCPKNILELKENEIDLNDGCEECGACAEVCPLGAIRPDYRIEKRVNEINKELEVQNE